MIADSAVAAQQAYLGFNNAHSGNMPVELTANPSPDEVDVVIRAVYRQVMGNAYVMESERLVSPESQLRQGNISVREFVRQVAQSELYRSRFVDNCYRYRSIELNFKHLLGRAPQSFDEMKAHSQVLDSQGFRADIDSYIDSDEYQDAFGEFIVPFYRGHQTQAGQTMLGYTNLLQLLRSDSSSDKALSADNAPQLTKAVIRGLPYGKDKIVDVQSLIADALRPKALRSVYQRQPDRPSQVEPETSLEAQLTEQTATIAQLRQQLADLRPFLSIGESMTRGFVVIAPENTANRPQRVDETSPLQRQFNEQATLIEKLQQEITAARPLAAIANAKLNKWRQRYFR
ncbi:MAG: phycobilisome rod-core linker polypeptide [Cyanobacteria bacterium J06632_22]